MLHFRDSGFGEANCGQHIQRIAAHQHHLRGLDRHASSSTDGDAQVSLCQCWRIVYSVAHHRSEQPFALELLHVVRFVGRLHLGKDSVDAQFTTDGLAGAPVISSQHRHLDAQCLELGDRFLRGYSHAISDRDQSDCLSVHGHEHRRFPLCLQRSQFLLFSGLYLDRVLCQQFRGPDHNSTPINLRLYTSSCNRFELAIGQEGKLTFLCSLHDGACKGMF